MDIMAVYREELKKHKEFEKTNYPFGKLDYIADPDNSNLYFAYLPKPKPKLQESVNGKALGIVYSLGDMQIQGPKSLGQLILHSMLPLHNLILASIVRGRQREKIAWQEWTKKYINSEPQYVSRNWIADGVREETILECGLLNLGTELWVAVDPAIYYPITENLSEVGLMLLKNLLSHQVDGDKVIKGLKSLAVSSTLDLCAGSYKLTENYLGPWIVHHKDLGKVTLSQMVEDVNSMVKATTE